MCRDPPSSSLVNHFLARDLDFEAFLGKWRASALVQPSPETTPSLPSVFFDELYLERHHLPHYFPTKPLEMRCCWVAKEVSFPDCANCPVVLKGALHGSDTSCFLVKEFVGPGSWQTEALSPNLNSQDPLKRLEASPFLSPAFKTTSLWANSLTHHTSPGLHHSSLSSKFMDLGPSSQAF